MAQLVVAIIVSIYSKYSISSLSKLSDYIHAYHDHCIVTSETQIHLHMISTGL